MSRQILIQQQDNWLVFDNGKVSRSDTRPRPERAALAVADFEGGVSSVVSLEGSPAHAVALIEKRLRADGLIDSEAKILIHKTRTVGAGYQALFTAAPLENWQQTFAWAEAQPDHCLLTPSTSILWSKLKTNQVIVYQSGRQISALGLLKHNMVYRTSLAYSDDASDLAMTAGVVAEQLANDLADGEQALDPMEVLWCPVLVPQPEDGGSWLDDSLREIFSARSGMAIRSVPVETVIDDQGRSYRTGARWLSNGASPFIAVNPPISRWAYVAEWALPIASAASVVFAIALASLGTHWTLNASEAEQQASVIGQQIDGIDSKIFALEKDQAIPQDFPAAMVFIEKINQLRQNLDPLAGMADIRDASFGQVRIMRVRVENPLSNTGSAPPPGTVVVSAPTLRVDGVVDADHGTPGMQVPTFIERLRQAGYEPVPLDPQSGGVGTGNFFSYLLNRSASTGTTP
jgi:hypothetical protein